MYQIDNLRHTILQTLSYTYTNGQKKRYTVYMSDYSIVKLHVKHAIFLT